MGLIFLLAIGLVIYAFWNPQKLSVPSGNKDALEILRERYARGEIDEAEFKQRKQTLEEK